MIDWFAALRNQKVRFWSKVNKSGPVIRPELGPCWVWLGKVDKDGYGQFMVTSPFLPAKPRQKGMRAHRASWILENGPIDPDVFLLHKCDMPACVRTLHLFQGNQADNIHDMVAKARHARGKTHGFVKHPELRPFGERNPAAKLTEAKVLEVHVRAANGETTTSIAKDLGVVRHTVNSILRGDCWSHLKPVVDELLPPPPA